MLIFNNDDTGNYDRQTSRSSDHPTDTVKRDDGIRKVTLRKNILLVFTMVILDDNDINKHQL